ncbi:MAG: hypothetical protein IKS99_05135 [Firmicutes bacterium]|nr:hypothetical protein [Bacillota bacterium]
MKTGNIKRSDPLKAIVCLLLSAALIVTMAPPLTAYASEKSISTVIAEKEAAVEKAEKDLASAQKKYETAKSKAAAKVKVTDKDLALVGREFINSMVVSAYEQDKDDKSAKTVLDLDELTIEGCISRAKKNSTCKDIIKKVDKSASSDDDTFEASINRSLSIDNLNKALDYIDECNKYRAKHGRKALKVSPYLMAASAVSAALSSRNCHVFVNKDLFVTYDGTKAYESFYYGYSTDYDPFQFWYVSEKAKADAGATTGISHFRMIVSKKYKQTGFNWIDKNFDGKMTAEQSFCKDSGGKAYTTDKFRKLFNEFVENKKAEILEEKIQALPIYKNKPDYLTKAEKKLNSAISALKEAVKSYKPSAKVVHVNYSTLKVKYSIPDGYDGVYIYRSTSGKSGTFKKIATKRSGTYYRNRKLTCGKKYYYKIKFYKTVNGKKVTSKYSEAISLKTRPAKTRNLTVCMNEEGNLTISWRAVKGASNYKIIVKRPDDAGYRLLKEGENVSGLVLGARENKDTVVVAEVTEDGTYTFKVRACRTVSGKKIYGLYSASVTVSTTAE